jgi:hypothetical protein
MSDQHTIKLSLYPEDRAIRAGDFSLLPKQASPPFINSQILNNFAQYTWIKEVQGDVPVYQEIQPTFDTIKMLQGTSFTIGIKAIDPSNINDIYSMDNLSFKWLKDGASIVSINRANGGVGIPAALIKEENCIPNVTGQYTCEVSNAYGTVEAAPVSIEVVDPLKHPLLHKNLILNGDGDGGNDGWQAEAGVKSMPFLNNIAITKNFGSFRLGGLVHLDYRKTHTTIAIPEFHFSTASHRGSFYNWYWRRFKADPNFRDLLKVSLPEKVITNPDDSWMMQGMIPQIVLNEDYNKSEYAGFFPGLAWMDIYNRNNNTNVVGLLSEFKNYTPTYFTREKLKFTKHGGKKSVNMTQVIDLSEAADFIDGNVYGVKYLTSQFFAYIGAGITDYKIKIQTRNGPKTLNYYIADTEQYYDFITKSQMFITNRHPSFPEASGTGNKKEIPEPDTDIEVMPMVYDRTSVTLDYLDSNGKILKTEVIDGPNEQDVWAIKEKTFFPITLYPIFEFIKPANNDITVFGQKYTDTRALAGFFDRSIKEDLVASFSKQKYKLYTPKNDINWSGLFANGVFARTAHPQGFDKVYDKAALFFLSNYDFKKYGAAYPGNVSHYHNHKKWRALNDYGAAAMFGVGRDIRVPSKTRSVKITVTFTHTSEIIYEDNPELKEWDKQEIYIDDWGNSTGNSIRVSEYGAPRCGITKMKFLLVANDIQPQPTYASYSIPPTTATVLGLQKARYSDEKAFNTADAVTYEYKLVMPENMPEPPTSMDPFIMSQDFKSYLDALKIEELQGALIAEEETVSDDPEDDTNDDEDINDDIAQQEDLDFDNGDFDQTNANPPYTVDK